MTTLGQSQMNVMPEAAENEKPLLDICRAAPRTVARSVFFATSSTSSATGSVFSSCPLLKTADFQRFYLSLRGIFTTRSAKSTTRSRKAACHSRRLTATVQESSAAAYELYAVFRRCVQFIRKPALLRKDFTHASRNRVQFARNFPSPIPSNGRKAHRYRKTHAAKNDVR